MSSISISRQRSSQTEVTLQCESLSHAACRLRGFFMHSFDNSTTEKRVLCVSTAGERSLHDRFLQMDINDTEFDGGCQVIEVSIDEIG